MDPILDEYRRVAETVQFSNPREGCVYVSGMEGRVLDEEEGEKTHSDFIKNYKELLFNNCCLLKKHMSTPITGFVTRGTVSDFLRHLGISCRAVVASSWKLDLSLFFLPSP